MGKVGSLVKSGFLKLHGFCAAANVMKLLLY